MRKRAIFVTDQMFLHYEDIELHEIVVACKVSAFNIDWLAQVTGAEKVALRQTTDRASVTRALSFGQGNVAEVGDYVINMGNSYRPLEGLVFEQTYER